MCAVHTLVTEVLAKLIHAIEATHDKALEVQLRSYSHVEVDVESVVVCDEGTRCRTTGDGLQDRSLHLEVATLVEEVTHCLHNLSALDEGILHMGVNHKVEVTLTIAHLRVCECVECLTILLLYDGKGTYRLREHGKLLTVYRQLASVCEEGKALNADEVTNIEELLEYGVVERCVALGADVVTTYIDLNTASRVLKLEERCRAHDTAAHDTSCDCNLLVVTLLCVVVLGNLLGCCVYLETSCGVWVDTQLAQRLKRLTAQLFLFTEFDNHTICF